MPLERAGGALGIRGFTARARLEASAAVGDQLGNDADGDLFGRDGAEVETDGGVDARQFVGVDALGAETRIEARDLRATANQADVRRVARERGTPEAPLELRCVSAISTGTGRPGTFRLTSITPLLARQSSPAQ